jgi:hypothetical protein
MNYIDHHIADRFEDFLQSWPKSTSEELRNYFGAYRKRIGLTDSENKARPYWIHLPLWIFKSFKANKILIGSDKKFLKDITWAQYCVFLAVRMHDDLYDGQSKCKNLIYAGDQLLVDSGKIFSKYFSRSSVFWEYYYNLIENTIRSIIKVDNLQRSHSSSLKEMLDCYAKVCSIFKIGALAICSKTNRMKAYKKFSLLIDKISIIGHMIDDLKDMDEDVAEGRFNSVHLFLNELKVESDKQLIETKNPSKQNLIMLNKEVRFIKKVKSLLPAVERSIKKINIPELKKDFMLMEDHIKSLENYYLLDKHL